MVPGEIQACGVGARMAGERLNGRCRGENIFVGQGFGQPTGANRASGLPRLSIPTLRHPSGWIWICHEHPGICALFWIVPSQRDHHVSLMGKCKMSRMFGVELRWTSRSTCRMKSKSIEEEKPRSCPRCSNGRFRRLGITQPCALSSISSRSDRPTTQSR